MTRLYYLRDFLTITVCAVCLEEEDYVIRKYTAWAMRWDDFIQGGVFYWFTGLLVSTRCPKKTHFQNVVGATVHWLNHHLPAPLVSEIDFMVVSY